MRRVSTEKVALYLCAEFNTIWELQRHSESLLTCEFHYAESTGFSQSCATFAIVVDV